MHYYQFNIGDYQSHTSHLSDTEDLAYRRMLDWCYLHEKPLPLEPDEVARQIRMRSHSDSITAVLQEYFERTESGWISERVIKEIEAVGVKKEKASASAKARWNKASHANALPTQSDSNATHNTEHKTQDTIKEAKASLSVASLPTCPHKEILKLWQTKLPNLVQPRVWEGARQASLRQRWIQASKPSEFSKKGYSTVSEGLTWWASFFDYIADDTKLAKGFETNGRVWVPDLEWVVNATNFQKIIDGKYNK